MTISLEILCNALSFFEISGNLNYYLKKQKKSWAVSLCDTQSGVCSICTNAVPLLSSPFFHPLVSQGRLSLPDVCLL